MYKRPIDKQLITWGENPNRKTLIVGGMVRIGKKTAISEYIKVAPFKRIVEVDAKLDNIDFTILTDPNTLMILHNFKSIDIEHYPNNLIMVDTNVDVSKYEAEYLRVEPISFSEFCVIMGASVDKGHNMKDVMDIYLTVGGMPECVTLYVEDSKELWYTHTRIALHKSIKRSILADFDGKMYNIMETMIKQTKKFKVSKIGGNKPTLKKYKQQIGLLKYVDSLISIPQYKGKGMKYIPADIALLDEFSPKSYIDKVYVGIALRGRLLTYWETNALPGSKSKRLYSVDYMINDTPLQVNSNKFRGFPPGCTRITVVNGYHHYTMNKHTTIPMSELNKK